MAFNKCFRKVFKVIKRFFLIPVFSLFHTITPYKLGILRKISLYGGIVNYFLTTSQTLARYFHELLHWETCKPQLITEVSFAIELSREEYKSSTILKPPTSPDSHEGGASIIYHLPECRGRWLISTLTNKGYWSHYLSVRSILSTSSLHQRLQGNYFQLYLALKFRTLNQIHE